MITFTSSQATTVTMNQNNNQKRVVNLQAGAHVNTIDFVGKPAGVVKLSGGATVGNIINGSKENA